MIKRTPTPEMDLNDGNAAVLDISIGGRPLLRGDLGSLATIARYATGHQPEGGDQPGGEHRLLSFLYRGPGPDPEDLDEDPEIDDGYTEPPPLRRAELVIRQLEMPAAAEAATEPALVDLTWTPPETPQPPRCHHAESGEKPVPGGLGEKDAETSSLDRDPTDRP